ncbi:methyltransferase domain-containing protein [Luteimonas sp. 50]|uniref:Methyltransferase domain-containing protein n=1 Tax=Cognatiluteimonas sedimenti TaxID=2927791 RepID=A0ABT0A448_9GAMM|nr:class I SAM-dependent methyltransferase [Lysobacter sedimenti]MCJ0825710.1 methyltransferase domain-containing protein [Lysobacter sedimenti]
MRFHDPIKLLRYALAGWLPGGRRRCVMCGHCVWRFMPYRSGLRVALMDALDMVGSDTRNHACPRCGAHDRERHLLMYMQASGLWDGLRGLRVLHFAPERHLSPRIAAAGPEAYVRCDLHPRSDDVRQADIQEMPFDAGSFDLVIANHVLEHVGDDRRALAEIHRVLKPGGAAILQTPYSAALHHTWSDPGIASEQARLQAYGQEDHARLFGRDIFDRFAASGLRACIATHDELLPGCDAREHGVNRREPFFLYRRAG